MNAKGGTWNDPKLLLTKRKACVPCTCIHCDDILSSITWLENASAFRFSRLVGAIGCIFLQAASNVTSDVIGSKRLGISLTYLLVSVLGYTNLYVSSFYGGNFPHPRVGLKELEKPWI